MKEIESIEALTSLMTQDRFDNYAFQSLDLTPLEDVLVHKEFKNCLFLGCTVSDHFHCILNDNNLVFPKVAVPFNSYPNSLYSKETLYNNYDRNRPESYDQTLDKVIYDDYLAGGKEAENILITLSRRLHDHSITNAIKDF